MHYRPREGSYRSWKRKYDAFGIEIRILWISTKRAIPSGWVPLPMWVGQEGVRNEQIIASPTNPQSFVNSAIFSYFNRLFAYRIKRSSPINADTAGPSADKRAGGRIHFAKLRPTYSHANEIDESRNHCGG